MDLQGRGITQLDELKYINDQFKYGWTEEQILGNHMQLVATETITFGKNLANTSGRKESPVEN